MRHILTVLLLCLSHSAFADVTVVTQIDPSFSGSTITAVAMRGGTELGDAECTNSETASGIWLASADLDLSGAGAGYVQVAFVDDSGTPVSTGIEFEIDGSGAEVDRLPFIDHSIATVDGVADGIKAKTDHLPSAAAGSNGGLPTVDANNRIAGIQGTITTLDGLDTAQDSQHTATQNALSTIDGNVDAILEDTGTTLPGTLAGLATQASVNTIDGIVDNIYTAFELNSGSYRLTSDAVANIGAVSLEPEDIDAIAEATALAVGADIGESVWTYDGDRLLTAGTNIVLAKGTGITGFNDVSVADIWTEGVSSYNDVATFGGIVKGTSNTVTTVYDHTSSMSSTGVVVATGGITTASFATGAITQEVFDDGVELGGGLTAEETRAALGLASANLDTQLSSIKTDTGTNIPGIVSGLTASGDVSQEEASIVAEMAVVAGEGLKQLGSPKELTVGDAGLLVGADFARDLRAQGKRRIASITSVTLHEYPVGQENGITFDSDTGTGVDHTQAKFKVTANQAGNYVVRVKVVYANGGGTRTGNIEFVVRE